MAAGLYCNAGLFYAFQSFYVDLCGGKQRLAQSAAQLIIICLKRLPAHIKYFSYK